MINWLWRGRSRASRSRGNVAVMTALAAVPIIFMAGLATDGARAWLLHSRLYSAVDAAALSLARNVGVASDIRNAQAADIFWANFAPGRPVTGVQAAAIGGTRVGFMGSSVMLEFPVQVDSYTVRVTANASIPAYFSRIRVLLGIDEPELRVRASAEARRADLGLELALVLDVTGSMDTNCSTPSDRTATNCGVTAVPRQPNQTVTGRNNNMDLLRLAAADLVNVLYGDRETVPNLWVSVVPYTTTINIHPRNVGWLETSAQTNLAATFSPTTWRGCIEARRGYPGAPADGDLVDYSPAEVPFRPFFYASTLGLYTRNGAAVPGDNDWARRLWNTSTVGQNAITEDFQTWRGNHNVGPNLGCPQTAVLPLTASKTTVLDTIQGLRPTFRGGTMGNIGLLGGWATISPRWRSAWNLGPAPAGHATPLPLNYNALYNRKAILMMTDGANGWHDTPNGLPGECTNTTVNTASFPTSASGVMPPGPPQHLQPLACPGSNQLASVVAAPGAPPIANNADYSAYGRRSDNRATPADINARMSTLCTNIKAAGIIIYTVVLNTSGSVDTATQTLYRGCASSPGNFFLVSQPNQLRPAFQQIGQQLANLRIVR